MFSKYFLPVIGLLALVCCSKPEPQPGEKTKDADAAMDASGEQFTNPDGDQNATGGLPALSFLASESQITEDVIPDFSRVGYKWGEEAFPDYPNVVNVGVPTGGDDTGMIQEAIDCAPNGSVILLQPGEYKVAGMLFLDRSRMILRGSGNKATTITATGTTLRTLISMTRTQRDAAGERLIKNTTKPIQGVGTSVHSDVTVLEATPSARTIQNVSVPIVEDAFCGSEFVTVRTTSSLAVGDRVCIFRPGTEKWLDAIHMREIVKAPDDEDVINQWTTSGYSLYWCRRIIGIDGNRVYLDNPVAMSLTREFGLGSLVTYSWSRVSESGIENLILKTEYDPSVMTDGYCCDEAHATTAIDVNSAEHCWVKGVDSWYFSTSTVDMGKGAINITVEDCNCHMPVSLINGGYRYAFHISGGELCLVRNCTTDFDRHAFVLGAQVCGPNAFVDCSSTNNYADLGPHQRWSTCCLYDNVTTNSVIGVYDAGNSGTGHGWRGANMVFWHCTAAAVWLQKPWASASNWAVGCTPATINYIRGYAPGDVLGPRPAGECRALAADDPVKLYEAQLFARKAAGLNICSIIY